MTGPRPRGHRAVRTALTDRLKREATANSRDLQHVRRQFVLRRFLTRVFTDQPDDWVLKGGTAMVLRIPAARPSKDLDLLRRGAGTVDDALRDLARAAARTDIDPFTFTITHVEDREDLEGLRLAIRCDLGPTEYDRFPIDLVIGKGGFIGPVEHYTTAERFTTPPEFTTSAAAAVYPVADQVADKLAAMYERHGNNIASTRYHDLVDLLLLADHFPIEHAVTVAAIDNQKRVRAGLVLPDTLTIPDPQWTTRWPALAARTQLVASLHTLDAALAHGRACYDALLTADATAPPQNRTWNPATRTWEAPEADTHTVTFSPRTYAAMRIAGHGAPSPTTSTPEARPARPRPAPGRSPGRER